MNGNFARLFVLMSLLGLTGCRFSGAAVAQDSAAGAPGVGTLDSAVTVLPVLVLGEPNKDVADALALLMEQEGMRRMATTSVSFSPPQDATWESVSASVGEFVRVQQVPGDFVIYAEFLGTPQTGATEVRAIVMDGKGKAVWSDRQTGKDAAFARARPKEPMECCALAAERIRPLFALSKATRKNAQPGPLAKLWQMKSGTPDDSEIDAMKGRQATLAKSLSTATIAVYPHRLGEAADSEQAQKLTALLAKEFGCKTSHAGAGWYAEVTPSHNEQKTLWQFAAAFRDEVRRQPPDADYAFATDYLLDSKGGPAWGVHFVVIDRHGEWVIVDFQNSHWSDYQAIKPKTADDADRLVIRRMNVILGK